MQPLNIVLVLLSCSGTAAQFGSLFDYAGLDMFMGPGYNEGPCIERTRRRRRRRRKATKPASVIVTPPTNKNKFREVAPANQPVNTNQVADPLFGGLDYMFNFLNPPYQPNPAPAPVQQPVPSVKFTNVKKTAGSKPLTIDYSKLTNSELNNLLEMAARQAGIKTPVINTKASPTQLRPSASAASTPTGSRNAKRTEATKKVPSYSELSRYLDELQQLATKQKNQALSKSNNAKGKAIAAGFRPLGRKARSAMHRIAKRQFPFDFMGMFGGNMGAGLSMAFCSCMPRSDVEADYIVQSRKKWKCKGRLVCACNPP